MKKALSIILCFMMALSCVLAGVSTASAATLTSTGTLNLYKNQTENDVPTEKAGLNGAEFSIYQVMKLDSETGLYSVTEAFEGVVTVDDLTTATNTSDGYLTYGNTDKLEAQISTLVAAITADNSTIKATATAATGGYKNTTTYEYTDEETTIQAGKASFENLAQGVYLVRETVVPDGYTVKSTPFLVALTTSTVDANGDIIVNAYPKNAAKGELDKVIVTDDGTQKNDSASIGDTIDYKITSQVPDYDTDTLDKIASGKVTDKEGTVVTLETVPFFFVDTLSAGLTLNESSIVVKIDGKEKTKGTDYTVTKDSTYTDGTRFVINFPFSKIYDKENSINLLGKNVEITYSATLNENAVVAKDDDNETNVNDLDLYYVSDPTDYKISLYYDDNNPKPNPDPDPTDEPDVDPVVYTYEMDLTKTLNGEDFTGDNTAVTFSLQYCATIDGTYADVNVAEATTGTAGSYKVATDGTATITLGTDGTLSVVGLKAGYYKLTELTTLSGYTLLTSPITICVKETEDAEGKVTGTVDANTYKIYDNGSTVENDLSNVDGKVGAFAITVNNTKSQFNLPTTGGIGLWIFTIGGAVILAAAVMIFVSVRKKKSAK